MLFFLSIIWRGTNFNQLFSLRNKIIVFCFLLVDLIFIAYIVIENEPEWSRGTPLIDDVFMVNIVTQFNQVHIHGFFLYFGVIKKGLEGES